MQDHDLDDLFASARVGQDVPPALMARVLADADAVQPDLAPWPVANVARPGFWAAILAAIGGARGVAGLSTAALAGLWIGFVQPSGLGSLTDALLPALGGEVVDVLPVFDDFPSEG
jgi:hypothetical protein